LAIPEEFNRMAITKPKIAGAPLGMINGIQMNAFFADSQGLACFTFFIIHTELIGTPNRKVSSNQTKKRAKRTSFL
jgi:hypothetical protein